MRHLSVMEQALAALQGQLRGTNPDLLTVTAGAYKRRIQRLKEQIAHY